MARRRRRRRVPPERGSGADLIDLGLFMLLMGGALACAVYTVMKGQGLPHV